MPIKKENRHLYPPPAEWRAIREAILMRSGNRCEGCILYPDCRAENGHPHPVTGSRVVLTIAHWPDPTPSRCQPENLHAWCNLCHNTMDAPMRARNRRMSRYGRGSLALDLEDAP